MWDNKTVLEGSGVACWTFMTTCVDLELLKIKQHNNKNTDQSFIRSVSENSQVLADTETDETVSTVAVPHHSR